MNWLKSLTIVAAACTGANAQVIDFEGAPGSGNPIYDAGSGPLVLGDFEFASNHFHTIDDDIGRLAANDSRVYIGHEGSGLGDVITMTRTDGGAFDVYGLDGAELWVGDDPSFPNATYIRVTGYFQGGGSVTDYLLLDGLLDGPGGIDDFETFSLAGFTNLIAFEMNGADPSLNESFSFGVDDIRLIPSAGTLALLGLGGLTAMRRRR